jgi:hypothetical protein
LLGFHLPRTTLAESLQRKAIPAEAKRELLVVEVRFQAGIAAGAVEIDFA